MITAKTALAAAAIGSAMMLAARERDPVTVTVVEPPQFGDRFPVFIPPPSEQWKSQARVEPEPVVEVALADEPPSAPPKAVRKARAQSAVFVCHKETYYRGRHRYWRCRR